MPSALRRPGFENGKRVVKKRMVKNGQAAPYNLEWLTEASAERLPARRLCVPVVC